MLYISLEVLQCINASSDKRFSYDPDADVCGGIFLSGIANSFFLLTIMYSKVVLIALSATIITRDDFMAGRLPVRFEIEAFLFVAAALCNLILYISRNSEDAESSRDALALLAVFSSGIACLLETLSVLFFPKSVPSKKATEEAQESPIVTLRPFDRSGPAPPNPAKNEDAESEARAPEAQPPRSGSNRKLVRSASRLSAGKNSAVDGFKAFFRPYDPNEEFAAATEDEAPEPKQRPAASKHLYRGSSNENILSGKMPLSIDPDLGDD